MKQKYQDILGCGGKKTGWMRNVLTFLSLLLLLLGVFFLVYMVWVIATSYHVDRFFSGSLIFTYSVSVFGLLMFLTGIIGWVASTSERVCTLKLYLTVLVIVIVSEIGGIVAIKVLGIETDQIIQNAWTEINQGTRDVIQTKMNCCGFEGAHEFSRKITTIPDSCYQYPINSPNNTINSLKPDGCRDLLKKWLEENKITWCSVSAVFGGLQLMCAVLCAHIIHKLKDKLICSRTSLQKSSSSQFI